MIYVYPGGTDGADLRGADAAGAGEPMSLKTRRRAEVLVAIAIALSFFVVWPVGRYAIEDDWIYTKSLLHLHDTGQIAILDYSPMSLVVHLLWGLLFTTIFGFSFTVVKLSTVTLLFVECVAVIALLRRVGATETATTMAALALLFNPLHFFQSFLYATDVPAMAWTMLAVLFYARGLVLTAPASPRYLLLASICASLSSGIRQSGALVIVAVFFYLLLFERRLLADVRCWLRCFLIPLVATGAFAWWYYVVHGPTTAHLEAQANILRYLTALRPLAAACVAYCFFAQIAFFLLPVLVATPPGTYRPPRTARAILGAITCASFLAVFLWITLAYDVRFPYLRNKVTMFGYLSPNEIIVGARDVLWTRTAGLMVSVLLLLGAMGFALRWLSGPPAEPAVPQPHSAARVTWRLVSLLLCLQLAYAFLTMGILFDRHLLMLLPTSLVVFVGALGPRARLRPALFTVCLLPLALYSGAGTHDVHAFSRTAFQAGEDLLADGVPPDHIDGGYAFDGWHMYERSQRELREGKLRKRARGGARGEASDAWYIHVIAPRILTTFVISLSETMAIDSWAPGVSPWARSYAFMPKLDNYSSVRTYRYQNYWPLETKELYVLVDTTLGARSRTPDRQATPR